MLLVLGSRSELSESLINNRMGTGGVKNGTSGPGLRVGADRVLVTRILAIPLDLSARSALFWRVGNTSLEVCLRRFYPRKTE